MSGFENMKKALYGHYVKECEKNGTKALSYEAFFDEVKAYKERDDKYLVYVGYSRKDKDCKKIIYVGTTIQYPLSRWFYHKQHGKNLVFKEYCRFDNENDMLDMEYELIQKYHPSCNKITKRRQNYNVVLTPEILESRKGNPEWCQCCLRRHVNKGYKYCYYCQTLR